MMIAWAELSINDDDRNNVRERMFEIDLGDGFKAKLHYGKMVNPHMSELKLTRNDEFVYQVTFKSVADSINAEKDLVLEIVLKVIAAVKIAELDDSGSFLVPFLESIISNKGEREYIRKNVMDYIFRPKDI